MRSSRSFLNVYCIAATIAMLLLGCAPAQLPRGVPYVTAKYKVADAKFQRVREYPGLRLDAVTADQLNRALRSRDLENVRGEASAFIVAAHADALASTRNELDRLSDAGWREISARYCGSRKVPDVAARERIWAQFVAMTDLESELLLNRIHSAENARDIRRLLDRIDRNAEVPAKKRERFARAFPWFVFTVPSLLVVRNLHEKEYRGPQEEKFSSAICYIPGDSDGSRKAIPTPRHWDLLQRHAPMILQEQPASPPLYDPAVDQFGRVLARTRERIAVDPSRPTVYAYARTVRVNGADHVQLVYTHWFPQHPKLKKKFDPEQGHLEGVTLRITLDRQDEPAIFETVYNCGCYHRLFPAKRLEDRAVAEFERPEPQKQLALEHNVKWKIDLIVPKVVNPATDAEDVPPRPLVHSKAGWHGLVDVALATSPPADETGQTLTYELLPYDELEHLPLPDDGGYTSMFYDNGLVRGAQRIEGIFFTPIGMLSAGQPRQRGTQLIHWDHWDFDDPHLFEKTLRLPSDF